MGRIHAQCIRRSARAHLQQQPPLRMTLMSDFTTSGACDRSRILILSEP